MQKLRVHLTDVNVPLLIQFDSIWHTSVSHGKQTAVLQGEAFPIFVHIKGIGGLRKSRLNGAQTLVQQKTTGCNSAKQGFPPASMLHGTSVFLHSDYLE